MTQAFIVDVVRTPVGKRGGSLSRRRFGLQTMCEGGGQANVTILERC